MKRRDFLASLGLLAVAPGLELKTPCEHLWATVVEDSYTSTTGYCHEKWRVRCTHCDVSYSISLCPDVRLRDGHDDTSRKAQTRVYDDIIAYFKEQGEQIPASMRSRASIFFDEQISHGNWIRTITYFHGSKPRHVWSVTKRRPKET